ncbi:MAG: hypothetical protein WDO14_19320 [Bacteroidota bacterium]
MSKRVILISSVFILLALIACTKHISPGRELDISQQGPAIKVSRTLPPDRKIYTGEEWTEFPSKAIPADKY